MTDMFVLLQLPNAGDELQAIKKGVMELADLVVINKADIDADAATRAQAQITSSLRILGLHGGDGDPHSTAHWQPTVLRVSALHGQGLDLLWQEVCRFQTLQTAQGKWSQRRQNQALAWMWERVDAGLKQSFHSNPHVKSLLADVTKAVLEGRMPASTAARNLLNASANYG
jgi:LAO/AO transport system kinase